MSASEIIARILALLEEERGAIGRIDGARVEAIANEKLALVQQLTTLEQRARVAVAPALRAMVAELRRNGILLVQAHGVLSGLCRLGQGLAPESTLARGRPRVSPPPTRVSVRA